jgi:hypothetical protein
MIRLLIALCLSLVFAIPALAAPGDPRFLQGTVEWPAALNGEPLMIVRGDDGRVYVADVSGARRQGAELVRVGGRVALLVIEGAKPHDVTAIVIAAGDAVSLARALSQGGSPTVPAAAATPPVAPAPAAPSPAPTAVATAPAPVAIVTPPAAAPAVAAPAPVTPTAPAPTAPAAVAAPAPGAVAIPGAPAVATTAPAPSAAAPAVAPAPGAPTVVVTPAPNAPAPSVAPAPSAPAVTAPAPSAPAMVAAPGQNGSAVTAAKPPSAAGAPAPSPTPGANPSGTVPPPPPALGTPNTPMKVVAPPGDRKQWARIDGKVQSVEGALLVLKADNGSVVIVDISQLNPNVSQALRKGRLVSVYGYPLEQKFEAAGYIELDPSHPEPPRGRYGR